jgi:hypothetical protein
MHYCCSRDPIGRQVKAPWQGILSGALSVCCLTNLHQAAAALVCLQTILMSSRVHRGLCVKELL